MKNKDSKNKTTFSDHQIGVYKHEILLQVQFAKESYAEIIAASSSESLNPHGLIKHIHHFLIPVGLVFDAIHPKPSEEKPEQTDRAERLKEEYPSLPQMNTDIKDARNHFEHYFERIDQWVVNSEDQNYADILIGPENAIVGIDKGDKFRHYNPQKKELYFTGTKYDLRAFYKFVREVEKALTR